MSNFYNTTGIEIISMVQEEQTEFNVLTEGFFGTIGDFIKRLWNGVISFIKMCYNKIKDFLKRIFGKKSDEELRKEAMEEIGEFSLINFTSFTRDEFEKHVRKMEIVLQSNLDIYDIIKDNLDDMSFSGTIKMIKDSHNTVINSLNSYVGLGKGLHDCIYLPNGSMLLSSSMAFKKSDKVIEGFKEIHEFYAECQKRLLDLVENFNKKLDEIYKWFDPVSKDPKYNNTNMKKYLSDVKNNSIQIAKYITELSGNILKWTQELEKTMLKMTAK